MKGKAWVWNKPNGRYVVRFRDDDGRTRSEGTFSTREEAERTKTMLDNIGSQVEQDERDKRAAQVMRDAELADHLMATGQPLPQELLARYAAPPGDAEPGRSLAEYLDTWIRGDRSLRETSRKGYLATIRNHIAGTPLGRTDVRRITPRMLEDFWNGLDPGRTGTAHVVRELLSKAFRRALRHDDIITNPFDRADLPRPNRTGPRRVRGKLTRENVEPLAAAASSERDRLAILLMAWCGLRPGEIGGLKVDGLNAQRCELTIEQQVTRATGGSKIGPPKTQGSYRIVGLPPSLCEDLARFAEDATDELIFRTSRGGLWGDRLVNRAVHSAAKNAGLSGVHAHLLRHLAGSMALEDGASVAEVAEMLGDTIAQVQQTYVEALSGARARIAARSEASRERFRNAE
jgi:integrase